MKINFWKVTGNISTEKTILILLFFWKNVNFHRFILRLNFKQFWSKKSAVFNLRITQSKNNFQWVYNFHSLTSFYPKKKNKKKLFPERHFLPQEKRARFFFPFRQQAKLLILMTASSEYFGALLHPTSFYRDSASAETPKKHMFLTKRLDKNTRTTKSEKRKAEERKTEISVFSFFFTKGASCFRP